jgi:hypothetical protein
MLTVRLGVDFMDEVLSDSQIKKDARALYGALFSACQSDVGRRILIDIETNRMAFVHGVNQCNNMRQMEIEMSASKH